MTCKRFYYTHSINDMLKFKCVCGVLRSLFFCGAPKKLDRFLFRKYLLSSNFLPMIDRKRERVLSWFQISLHTNWQDFGPLLKRNLKLKRICLKWEKMSIFWREKKGNFNFFSRYIEYISSKLFCFPKSKQIISLLEGWNS
jgi:hypothetical protein